MQNLQVLESLPHVHLLTKRQKKTDTKPTKHQLDLKISINSFIRLFFRIRSVL